MSSSCLLRYISRDNPSAAKRLRERAKKTLKRLQRFPNSARIVPEFPTLPYREVIVPPYRFFYRLEGKIVWIVAVWHGAQIPLPPED
ncbi:MAG TPA: type II toxin-antitoxin system RelE/ParE family toxin [Blastocatellia bacterium]